MNEDIEVLMSVPKDVTFRRYGANNQKMTTSISGWKDQWEQAESLKFAKNGSVYANVGNLIECDLYLPRWYKKGKWRHIVFVDSEVV